MLKKFKLIISSIVILLVHFSILIFLVTSDIKNVIYEDTFTYVLLLMLVGAIAFYISYYSYHICRKSKNARMFILSLVFYIFGLTLLVQAIISGSEYSLFAEYKAVFRISQYYGFFAGSILLFGLAFPLEKIKNIVFRFRSEIFLITTLVYSIILFSLLMFPQVTGKLNELIDFFIGLTGIFFFILIVFLLQEYREVKSKFIINLIIGLLILINAIIINFFDYDWNLLWWYTHIIILFGFLVILTGLLRSHKQSDDIEIEFGPLYTKISTKLVVSFLLVVVLSIFTTGYISYSAARNNLKEQALDNLKLLTQTKKIHLSSFLKDLKYKSISIADESSVREYLLETYKKIEIKINENARKNNEDKTEIKENEIKVGLNEFLKQKQSSYDDIFYKINIINRDGIVIASTNNDEIGVNISNEIYFAPILNFKYSNAYLSDVFFSEKEKMNSIVVGSPIINKNTKEKIGIVVNFVKADSLNSILINNQVGGLAQSVDKFRNPEIYLVNRENWLITNTSFKRNAVLKEVVMTHPVMMCKLGDEVNEIYKDYRNISVIGSSACFSNGWTLIIEEDEYDVFAGLEIIKMKIALSSMIVMALVLILTYFLIKKIIDPIKNLSETAQKISQGDLSVRAKITSRGEIGILAQSFNQMTESLINASKYVRNMIKIMPTALIAMDAKGKIDNVNEAALKMLGYKQKELLNNNISIIFNSKINTLDALLKDVKLKDLIRAKHVDNKRTFLYNNKQEKIPVLLSASVLSGSNNELKAIIFVAKDLRELTEYAKKRLSKITPILKRVAKGDFSKKIDISKEKDEFTNHLIALNIMIDDFRRMMNEIQDKSEELEDQYGKLELTSQELEEAKIGLEQKVKDRTHELQEKLLELERFNRIAVGRELKMMELKNEIKKLQSQKSKVESI